MKTLDLSIYSLYTFRGISLAVKNSEVEKSENKTVNAWLIDFNKSEQAWVFRNQKDPIQYTLEELELVPEPVI